MYELSPWHREHNLFNFIDSLEGNLLAHSHMRTDIIDKGDHYELLADLPGFQKEDISITVHDDTIRIQAKMQKQIEKSDNNNRGFIKKERKYGSLYRAFRIENIAEDKITASFDNGLLTMTLPKADPQDEENSVKKIDIQ
ncbi:MAG: Hsp20/alpha crystallin family protein [Bacillota bacterium]|jgi:HSP20 family protein